MEYSKYYTSLAEIASQVSGALSSNFVGFYVSGSFVMDAWNEQTSDIDFIVITNEPLTEEEKLTLGRLHQTFQNNEVGKKLEGEYIDLTSLRSLKYENVIVANVQDGKLELDSTCKLSADNVLCLIQFGKTLAGKPIPELGLSVSKHQYIEALREMLIGDKVEAVSTDDFHELYDILINTLRCIYGVQTKKLPTKAIAIEYSKEKLGEELYTNIINFRAGNNTEFPIDKNKLQGLIDHGLASSS